MWTVSPVTGWRTRSLRTTGPPPDVPTLRSITAPACASAWRRMRASTANANGSSPPP